METLKGKIALVTGGSRGIGAAVALSLAGAGADVAVNFQTRAEDAEKVCLAIRNLGRRALAIQADVSQSDQVKKMVAQIERELGPVKSAVKLEQGKMVAPLAFTGSYNATLLGCLEFRGWANTEWNLEFDRRTQTLQARIKITEMHLENIPSLAQGSIVTLVQTAIDSRINPVKILRPDQLSSVVPIAPSGGSLRLRAKEVIPEIVPGSLRLRILYEFLPEK